VSLSDAVLLLGAGILGGLAGSIGGLASLATYPALLAVGLSPVTANVTNTLALVWGSVGSVTGSRPELRGQRDRVRPLAAAGLIGGVCGGLLLLVTPAEAFERVVPGLIAIAGVALLVQRNLVLVARSDTHRHHIGPGALVATGAVGVYAGYFGAGAGVMVLALFLWLTHDTMPRVNALKNVVLGLANGVAALAFAVFGDVRWAMVVPLGAGALIGGRIGPIVVRRAPARPLQILIGLGGIGLAVKLAIDAY
jgi:uncharacterized membrane protein YfcA